MSTTSKRTQFTQELLLQFRYVSANSVMFSQAVAVGSYLGTRTDQLDLRLDLTGTTTVAGDYTGTLNLQAIVQ